MSASTWSRTETRGNLEPHGFPSGCRELGPVDPRKPPSTLVAIAHQRSVSIGAPGPATPSHQPSVSSPGPVGPVTCESPVRACSTTTTLSRFGESSPHRCTAIVTSSTTAPFSSVSGPMSTRPTSPSAGRVAVFHVDFQIKESHQNAAAVFGSVAPDALNGLAAAKPCSRSARMSSMPSMPTARRTSPGVTPVASCSSGDSCACVVDAGWMTSERTSPMLATWLCSVRALTNALPASTPPASSNASTAPVPLGASFFPSSYHGEVGRPA